MAEHRVSGVIMAILLTLVIAAALVALAMGWLSLDLVRDITQESGAMVARHPVVSALILFGIVVLLTTLCFPVAPLIGMTGGAMLGLWSGFAVVLAATTIGSSLACIGARQGLSGLVSRRFARRLAQINAGLERHGAAYLLSLRLNPVIPYWPVNLAFGCTAMPLRQFAPLTLIGLAPSIFVYSLAGTHLADLDHLGQVGSAEIFVGLLVLSLMPLAYDRLVLKRRAKA